MSNQLMQFENLSLEQLQVIGNQIVALQLTKMQEKVEELSDELAKTKADAAITKHRVDNLDATNIDGNLRLRRNSMGRKYSFDRGITFTVGWQEFTKRFNLAYRRNLGALVTNLSERKGRPVTKPEALEEYGLIEDAVRVADKMING